jgi:predicted amidohydrolase
MKIAGYQAPLESTSNIKTVLGLVREQIDLCEANGADILCCPEAVLGGLADQVGDPQAIVYDTAQLEKLLAPLSSESVTTIIGFTETKNGKLYNSAAVFQCGAVTGVYRKLHPAINHSVYSAGEETPVFTVGGLTFGILICYDSNFPEIACAMASAGAKVIFVPTNNGLPKEKNGAKIAATARNCDIRIAIENGVHVVRADVAGNCGDLVSHGSSEIVAPDGKVIVAARPMKPDLLFCEI